MKTNYRAILFSDINNLEESTNVTYNRYAELYRKLYKQIRRKYEIPKMTQHLFSNRINMNSIFYSVINLAINEYSYVKNVSEDPDAFLDHKKVFLLIKKNLGDIHISLLKYLNIEKRKKGKFKIHEHKEKEVRDLVNKIFIDVEKYLNKKTIVYQLKLDLKKQAGTEIPNLDLILKGFLDQYKKAFTKTQVIYEKDIKEIENQNIIIKQKSLLDTEKIKTEALTENYVDAEKEKIELQKKLKKYKDTIKLLRTKYKKRNDIFNRTKMKNRLLNERIKYLNKELDNIENYDSYSKSSELLRKKIDILNDELMKYREGKEKYKKIRQMEMEREDLRALLSEKLLEIEELRLLTGEFESDQLSKAQYKKLYEMYAPKVRELETQVKELDERLVMVDKQYLSLNNELDFKVNNFILKKFTDEQLKSITTIDEKRLNLENLKSLVEIYEKFTGKIEKQDTLRRKMIEAYIKNISPENGVDMFKINLKNAVEKRDEVLKREIENSEGKVALNQAKIGAVVVGTLLGLLSTAYTVYKIADVVGNLGYGAYKIYTGIQKDKAMSDQYLSDIDKAEKRIIEWQKEVDLMEGEKARIQQEQKQEEWNEELRWIASKVTHGRQIPVTWEEAKRMGYAKLLAMPLNLWNKRQQRLQNERKAKELEDYMKKDAYNKIMDLAISDRNLSLMFFREDPNVTRAFQLLTENNMTISLEDVNRSFLDFIRVVECHVDIRRSMKLRILNIFRRRKGQYLFLKSKLEICDIFQIVVAYVLLSRNFRKYYVDIYGFDQKDLISVVYIILKIYEESRSASMEDLRNDLTFVDKIDYVNERGFYTKEKTVFELVFKRAGSFYDKILTGKKIDDLTYENYHVNKKGKKEDLTAKIRMEIIIRRIVNMDHFNLSRLIFFASPMFSFLERFRMFHEGSEDDMAKIENIFGDGVNIFSENEQEKLVSLTGHKNKITDIVDKAGELDERYRDIDASIFVNLVKKQEDILRYSIKSEKDEKQKHFVAKIPKNGILWMVLMIVNSIKKDLPNLSKEVTALSVVQQTYKNLIEYTEKKSADKEKDVFIPSMKMLLLTKNFVSYISLLKYFLDNLEAGLFDKLFGVNIGRGVFCTQKRLDTEDQKKKFKDEKMKKLIAYSGDKKSHYLNELLARRSNHKPYKSQTIKCEDDETLLMSEEMLLETGRYVLVKAKRDKEYGYISSVSPEANYHEYFGRTYELHCYCYYDYKDKHFAFYQHIGNGKYDVYHDHTQQNEEDLGLIGAHMSDDQTDYIFFIYKLKGKIGEDKKKEMQNLIKAYKEEKTKSKIGTLIGNKMNLLKKTEDLKDNLEKKIEEERFRMFETNKSRVISKSKDYDKRIKKYRDENEKYENELLSLSVEIKGKKKLFDDGVKQLIEFEKKESKEYEALNNDMSTLNSSILRLKMEEDNIKSFLKKNNERIVKYTQKRKRLEEKNKDALERIVKMREAENRRKIELNEKRIRSIQERERLKEEMEKKKKDEEKRLEFEKKQKEKRIKEREKEVEARYKEIQRLKKKSEAIRRKQEKEYKREQDKIKREQEKIEREKNRERRQIARQEMTERKRALNERRRENDKKLRTLDRDITRENKNIDRLNERLDKLDFNSWSYNLKQVDKGMRTLDRFGSRFRSIVEDMEDLDVAPLGSRIEKHNPVEKISKFQFPVKVNDVKWFFLEIDKDKKKLTYVSKEKEKESKMSYDLSSIKLYEVTDPKLQLHVYVRVGKTVNRLVRFLTKNDYNQFLKLMNEHGFKLEKEPNVLLTERYDPIEGENITKPPEEDFPIVDENVEDQDEMDVTLEDTEIVSSLVVSSEQMPSLEGETIHTEPIKEEPVKEEIKNPINDEGNKDKEIDIDDVVDFMFSESNITISDKKRKEINIDEDDDDDVKSNASIGSMDEISNFVMNSETPEKVEEEKEDEDESSFVVLNHYI